MARQYTNISIPLEVMEHIDEYITDSSLGYTSRTQFILEAIRARFLELRRK